MNKNNSTASKVIFYTVCSIIAIVFIFPVYYTLINSLRPIYSTPAILTPKGFEWINFKYAVTLIPFFTYLKNSCIILAITLGIGMPLNFIYGYALARIDAPGKKVLFFIVLAQLMVPGFALQIPQYILFSNIGFRDTYWIWVITAIGGTPFLVFLYRQYLLSMPKSLEEAAFIDGCSIFQVIVKIIAPLSKPVMAIAFFKDFILAWGDFMTSYMYLSKEKYPLSMVLFSVDYSLPSNPGVKLVSVVNAASLLLMIPVVIVFFFCQKYLVQGVAFSGVKG